MTPQQASELKVGDDVWLRGTKGRVTQRTRVWFMVMWEDGYPEIIRFASSILLDRLEKAS